MTASLLSLLPTSAEVISGISWEPEIRGLLTVALAAAALIGSVWLLLVTNTGIRLGSLITLAGFFAWMTMMASVWWLFGIGYVGDAPTWEFVDSYADEAGAETSGIEDAYLAEVDQLPDPNCNTSQVFPPAKTNWTFSAPRQGCTPKAIALVLEFDGAGKDAVIEEYATVDEATIRQNAENRNNLLAAGDPRKLNEAGLEQAIQAQIERQELTIDQLSLSTLASGAPQVIDWARQQGYLTLTGGWKLLPSAEAGEANAAAELVLAESGVFAADPDAATPAYTIVDAYQRGGKPKPQSDSLWDRAINKVTNSALLGHPTNYAVIQARPVVPRPQVPGEPPPLAEIDRNGQTLSILLERNLGDRRLVPGLVTIGSGLIFVALCINLHVRELRIRRRDEEYAELGAGGGGSGGGGADGGGGG